jgi:phospholipid/cholesterol/gamma-HCH transport system substrate-binding protein
MQEVRSGKGLIHGLVYEKTGSEAVGELFKASRNVSQASENLSLILQQAREGSGLIHDLLYTEVQPGAVAKRIDEILSSFAQTANNVRTASEALSRGTGTLGALLVDPKLYDNLVEVTDGAKRSFLLRQAVRSSLNQ